MKFIVKDFELDSISYLPTIHKIRSGDEYGWKPIETCPREKGGFYLVYAKEEGANVGYWTGGHWQLNGFSDYGLNPTHWMPLPEGPK